MQIIQTSKPSNIQARPPKWIVLGVNNVCNLHCKMCDVGTQSLDSNFAQNLVGTRPINMPLELINTVIQQTSEHFKTAKLGYAFTEPLIYPHLIESLQYAREKGVYTTVTTNGLFLDKKARLLAEAEPGELYISLDGPESIHNEIRGNPRSFQKALEGIAEYARYNSTTRISVICAITQWNIGFLTELLESLEDYPIYEVAIMHTQFNTEESARAHNMSKWGLAYHATSSNVDLLDFEKMDLEKLHAEIHAIHSRNFRFKVYFSPNLESLEQLRTYYQQPEQIMGKGCNAVFSNIMIKSDGSAIPAHGRCYNLTIGNLYQQSLLEIWQSPLLKQLQDDLTSAGGLFPGCGRCCSAV